MSETDPILELDALLDPARLAAAWQTARERSPVEVADAAGAGRFDDAALGAEADALEADALEADVPEADAPETDAPETDAPEAGEPARAAPLPVALAHRRLCDEIERTWAASPGAAANARRVLSAPLAQLAAAIEPVDLAAAEIALDQLEDVLQALLSETGWPESAESAESAERAESDED